MSTSAESTGRFWRCATCGKHVPARENTCRCGTVHASGALEIRLAAVEVTPAADKSRSSIWSWALVLLASVLGTIALQRSTSHETRGDGRIHQGMQPGRPRGVRRPVFDAQQRSTSDGEGTPTAPQARPSVAVRIAAAELPPLPAPTASVPALIEAPTPTTGMEAERARAGPLRARLDSLSRKADDLDVAFQTYLDSCQRYRTRPFVEPSDDSKGGGSIPQVGGPYGRAWFYVWTDRSRSEWPMNASCRSLWSGITQDAASVKQELDQIEEVARASGIIPGVMRDLRRAYRLAFD